MRVLLPLLFALAQCRTPPAAVDKAGLPMGRPWKYDRGIVTTCGVGTASHNAGRWKPRCATSMEAEEPKVPEAPSSPRRPFCLGSKLPIVFVSFSEEPGAHAECLGDATLRAGAVDCVQLNASYAMLRGYGYSKIVAVSAASEITVGNADSHRRLQTRFHQSSVRGFGRLCEARCQVLGAPVREVLWVDADCWFVGDPSRLFYDEAYLRAGAAFWPDFFGYFGEDESLWTKLGGAYGYGLRGRQCDEGGDVRWYSCANPKCNLRHNCSTDAGLEQCACPDALGDPRSHWDAVQGFDSGLFLVDKARHAQPLRRLARLADLKDAAHWDFAWYSHDQGDKDLWHLAWLLERANYTLAPLNGVVASKSTHSAGKLGLVSQAKMDAFGRVIALHQNWRPLAAAASALVVVDLRRVDAGWRPPPRAVQEGFALDDDAPRIRRLEPAPLEVLDSLAVVRRVWFDGNSSGLIFEPPRPRIRTSAPRLLDKLTLAVVFLVIVTAAAAVWRRGSLKAEQSQV